MKSATDVRHLPAGIPRAIAMLTLAFAATVAAGQALAFDGGSKDCASLDDVSVGGTADVVRNCTLRSSPAAKAGTLGARTLHEADA